MTPADKPPASGPDSGVGKAREKGRSFQHLGPGLAFVGAATLLLGRQPYSMVAGGIAVAVGIGLLAAEK